MPTTQISRDSLASWYAGQHLNTDPGLIEIHYLPANAPDREIRLIEVNCLLGDRNDESLEPIEFGIDRGTENEHHLLVLDVTPEQWGRISSGQLAIPANWSLEEAKRLP